METNTVLQRVKVGERATSADFLRRVDVAEGTVGRVKLIGDEFFAASTFFSQEPIGNFYCSQQEALEHGLEPRLYYYAPCLRLTTDARGNVVSPAVTVEYLRLSSGAYNDFCTAAEEAGSFTTVMVTKDDKGQYSTIKVTPSNKPMDEGIAAQIEEVASAFTFDTISEQLARSIARPFKVYLDLVSRAESDRSLGESSASPRTITPPRTVESPAPAPAAAPRPLVQPKSAEVPTATSTPTPPATPKDFDEFDEPF